MNSITKFYIDILFFLAALFTTINQPNVINTQSSVDTRTHLQLFQTMLNIQPFNNELAFLARNIKVNKNLFI